MKAIRRAHPDYESARMYAILSLNETLQDVAAQLAELTYRFGGRDSSGTRLVAHGPDDGYGARRHFTGQ